MTALQREKNPMRLWNFLLVFLHLVDINILDLLNVSLSSSFTELPSLEEEKYDKYMFGYSCTMGNINQDYITPMNFS